MRVKTVFFLFCFFQAFCLSAQFIWSNPQPSGWTDTKVVFTDAATGYVMNNNGELLKTANGGAKWKIEKNFPKALALDAKDSFLVIGGSDTTVYLSTDRGQTWKTGIIRQKDYIEKFQIISKDTVFALCKSYNLGTSELHLSKDGGLTWQLVNGSFIIKGLDFINSKLGYATSFGGVFKTVDGGLTWQQSYNQTGGYSFTTVRFMDGKTGFAAQDLGVVIKTTDGGATWNTCLASTYERVYTIAFANAATVYLAGEDGTLHRSTDTGATWQFKPNHTGDRYGINSVHFTNPTTGFFVGIRGQIFKTTDGGNSYTDYSPTYTDVKPLSFPTPSVGYAGVWADLFKTTDGGQSWTKLPFGAGNALYSRFQYLHFFSRDTGLALSETPVQISKTYDGGQTWLPVTVPPVTKNYIQGFFALGNTVYLNVKGSAATYMLQSRDRGETWRTQAVNPSNTTDFQTFFFTDEKTGFAIMGPGLHKTTDSAKTWSPINLYNNYGFTLNSVWFTSPATGYIGADQGFNLTTADSGKTWTQFAVQPGNYNFSDVYAVRFFNKNVGYLTSKTVGVYSNVYKTTDAGKTWSPEQMAPWDCKTLAMTADTSLFIGGLYGVILKKDMREYGLDSLTVSLDAGCSTKLSAKVTAVLSAVDSIRFQYGTAGFTKTVLANPSSVSDSSVKVNLTLTDLSADSTYQWRLKIRYRGTDQYSSPLSFRPTGGLPKPTITFNGTNLASSASAGNQWYVNGVAIAGATAAAYQPTTQGLYTVQQKLNGCLSSMSDGFTFMTTGLVDPVLAEAVRILPNPVTSTLWIKNKDARKLQIVLMDGRGRILKEMQTAKTENTMDLQHLSAGVYALLIEDAFTHKKTTVKLMKL